MNAPAPPHPLAAPLGALCAMLRRTSSEAEAHAIAAQAEAFCRRLSPAEPGAGAIISQLAMSVALPAARGVLPQGDVLAILSALGEAGEIAAVRLLRPKGDGAKAAAETLAGQPAAFGLTLAERLVALPHLAPEIVRDVAETRLSGMWNNDPEEVMAFLDTRTAAGRPLCRAAQNRLAGGRFGVWLEKLCKVELDPAQVAFVARVASGFESERLHELLARRLDGAEECPTEAALAVLAALAKNAPKGNAGIIRALRPMLRRAEPEVRRAAALALIRLGAAETGLTLHRLATETGSFAGEYLGLAARLSSEEFFALLKNLPQAPQRELLAMLALAYAKLDPNRFEQALVAVAPASGKDAGPLSDAVSAYVSGPARPAGLAGGVEQTSPATAGRPAPPASGEIAAPAPGRADGLDWRGKRLSGRTVSEVEFENLEAAGSEIAGSMFHGCRITGADFAKSRLSGCVFSGCVFTGSDFSGASIEDCRFTDCRFEYAIFVGSRLSQARFEGCHMASCSLADANLVGLVALTSHIDACDFSGAALTGADLAGCRIVDTVFSRAGLTACVARNCRSTGLSFAGSDVKSQGGDDPEFLRAAEESLLFALDSGAAVVSAPRPGPELQSANAALMLTRLAERWFFERDAAMRLRRMLANNRRRLDWAMAKMGSPETPFLALLPWLISTPRLPGDSEVYPDVRLPGFAPDVATRELAARIRTLRAPERAPAVLPAEALYVMGSCGTIAQSRDSDVDVWLCLDGRNLPRTLAARLTAKLRAIEELAAKQELEVHIYLMDVGSILAGDFGFSDEESSGSAQSMLLKEEFYRTAMWLAGKKPAWWLMPARATKAVYTARLRRLTRGEGAAKGEIVDLGQVEEADRTEFFGASLWQMAKALKSPFKSVLKFGLLERYFLGRSGEPLLCERIKDDIVSGRLSLWDADPYAVLFRELYEFYRRSGREEARRLTGMAFLQKSGLFEESARDTAGIGANWLDSFFSQPHSQLNTEIRALLADGASRRAPGERSFAGMLALGDMIGRFMFSTYELIQNRLKSPEESLVINEHDLTKVGRKLFSRLKPRKNKIMRIPFVSSPRGFFTSLEITCEVTPGGGPAWVVRGLAKSGDGPAGIEEIRRDPSIVGLCAWLAANEIYRPGMHLAGSSLLAPVSLTDIRSLIEILAKTFPAGETFDPPLSESLKDEQITSVLFVLNFQTPREDKRPREAYAIYATNWGELFCLPFAGAVEELYRAPSVFLAKGTGRKTPPWLPMAVFKPDKSQCPDLVLA